MKRYLILIISVLVCTSCNRNPKSDEFKIEGFLTNGESRFLVIHEISPSGNILIDTIWTTKNGEFEYTYKMPYKSFYTIETDKNEYITFLPDYQEIINFEGDYEHLSPTYGIDGSSGSQLLWKLNKKELEGISILNEINKTWRELANTADSSDVKKQLDSLYYETWIAQKMYYYDFIHDNKGSLATLMALYKTFNQRKMFPVETDAGLYQIVSDGLNESLSGNPHTKHFDKSYQWKSVQTEANE